MNSGPPEDLMPPPPSSSNNRSSLTRVRRRGMGRGEALGSRGGSEGMKSATLQDTDNDAAVSRLSAVNAGYLVDRFASLLRRRGCNTRRLPIINRGTYTRTTAVDMLVESFLRGERLGQARQIISLGAGTDTRAFRLVENHDLPATIMYHEIDFPDTSSLKHRLVHESGSVVDMLDNRHPVNQSPSHSLPQTASWSLSIAGKHTYTFHPLDLHTLISSPASSTSSPSLTTLLPGLDPDVPTILLSECCLCYLQPEAATSIMERFVSTIQSLGIVLYEPVGPDDAFGQVMVSNLLCRGITMPTLKAYPTIEAQKRRLREAGFCPALTTAGAGPGDATGTTTTTSEPSGNDSQVRVKTIKSIWEDWIPEHEKIRLSGLEIIDELEEWDLLASHYTVAWAWKGDGFEAWRDGKIAEHM